MDLTAYFNKRTLVLGDVNTGKTTFCRAILEAMLREGLAARIAVIELAPEVSADIRDLSGLHGVGGKLAANNPVEVAWLSASFVPPRLSSKNEQEAQQRARENAVKILALFKRYGKLSRDILFINDISMFLQSERAERVVELTANAKTIVANGYYGEKLGAGALSLHERKEMESLKSYFDDVVLL